IAGVGDCLEQAWQAVLRRFDARLLGGQIDADAAHVGDRAQGAFDAAHATGTGHTADRQIKRGKARHKGSPIKFAYRIDLATLARSSAVLCSATPDGHSLVRCPQGYKSSWPVLMA